jgi:hypothetical protein
MFSVGRPVQFPPGRVVTGRDQFNANAIVPKPSEPLKASPQVRREFLIMRNSLGINYWATLVFSAEDQDLVP